MKRKTSYKPTDSVDGNEYLTCIDCGEIFCFSDDERTFYKEKRFSIPKHCRKCRKIKKVNNNGEQ